MNATIYFDLLESYLGNQVSAERFRERFNEAFQAEPVGMNEERTCIRF